MKNCSPRKKNLKELPRRTAKIRRTFPHEGIEKTELRFVVYHESNGQFKKEQFLAEVADFFVEQAKRLGDKQIETNQQNPDQEEKPVYFASGDKKKCLKKCSLWEIEQKSGVTLVKDVKGSHYEKKCSRTQAFRASLPILEKLINRIRKAMTYSKKKKELVPILQTAEQVYEDTQRCLREGKAFENNLYDRILVNCFLVFLLFLVSEQVRHGSAFFAG